MKQNKWLTYFSPLGQISDIWVAGLFLISLYSPISTAEIQAANTQQYSLWGTGTLDKLKSSDDISPVELGMKFRVETEGSVSAVRFYRAVPINRGYTVHIWSTTGKLLGTGIAIEGQQPTPGWQTVQIYPPVTVKTGVTYVASYYASNGQYSISQDFFSNSTVTNGPLHALGDGVEDGNGVFVYGMGGGFPTQSYKASNYWVDVIFTPSKHL